MLYLFLYNNLFIFIYIYIIHWSFNGKIKKCWSIPTCTAERSIFRIFIQSYVWQISLNQTKIFPVYASFLWTHPALLHRSDPEWTAFIGPWVVAAVCRTLRFSVTLSLLSILLVRFMLVNCGQRRKISPDDSSQTSSHNISLLAIPMSKAMEMRDE